MVIDAHKLKEMFVSGAQAIVKECNYINQLNVFPVPDGDTGTNLKMTVLGGIEAIIDNESVSSVSSQYSHGLLMNARGNSGVIFSQIIKGFSVALKDKKEIDDIETIVNCFEQATKSAYKAVMAPVEGTILTVIRVTSEHLRANISNYKTFSDVFESAVKIAEETEANTPKMLPVLAEANLVDSGGYGLQCFISGMNAGFKKLENNHLNISKKEKIKQSVSKIKQSVSKIKDTIVDKTSEPVVLPVEKKVIENSDENYGYCCEFIVALNDPEIFNFSEFEKNILKLGRFAVLVPDNDIVKVHIHSMSPSKILNYGEKFGSFLKVKIENMTLQVKEHKTNINIDHLNEQPDKIKKISLIVAVPSKEIGEYLVAQYAITSYINQAETGNVSTKDYLDAINKCNTEDVIIVTDNSNITLSAYAARKESKNKYRVNIVAAKSIIELLNGILVFDSDISYWSNMRKMRRAIKSTYTGFVSTSVRNIKYDSLYVNKGDYIGLYNSKVIFGSKDEYEILKSLVDLFISKNNKKDSIIQIIIGIGYNVQCLSKIKSYIESKNLIVDVIIGNQTIYPYIIGI